MANARLEANWDETATVLAMIHNVNCRKTYHQKGPAHFHPIRKRQRAAIKLEPKQSVRMLSRLLVPR